MQRDEMIVVCRQASDPRRPGSVAGFWCRSCGKELQVSPSGVKQIQELGGAPYCNGCGFTRAQKLQARFGVGDIVLSEAAQQALRERGQLDQVLAGNERIEVTPEEFFDVVKLRQKIQRAASN